MKINAKHIALFIAAVVVITCTGGTHQAIAADAHSFNAGHIIDDAIFTNSNSMSVAEIQSFLDSKMPNCDTNGTQLAGGGTSSMTNRQWIEKYYGKSPPYRCVRDYRENPDTGANNYGTTSDPSGSLSSAELISKYSKMYNISPKTLIVTLQKENGLITDNIPVPKNYSEAMGFGCPDNQPPGAPACDPAYGSFSTQLYQAARHFRGYMDRPAGWYVPYTVGWNTILWNPNGSCGTSDVYIENAATAALYSYTPYRPNQAALNAQYGTGDGCSSYGNRNFFMYFTDWFGDTQIQVLASFAQRYSELGGQSGVLGKVTMNQVCGLRNNGCYQGFQNGGIYWSAASGTFESIGPVRARYVELGAENSNLGYPASALICGLKDSGCYQGYQKGSIYYSPKVGRAYENAGSFRDRYLELGTETGLLGYPASATICGLRSGGCYQGYENGAIYKSAFGTYENYGVIRDYYLTTGTENGLLGYPSGSPRCDTKNNGCYQIFERGSVYQTAVTGTHSVIGGIYAKWSSAGKEWGALGFPITDEIYGAKDGGSYQQFEGGYIYWTPKGGRIVLNSIAQRWQELGKEWGKLGYPVTDSACGIKNDGCYQVFENGNTVYWSQPTGSKTVWGAIYTAWNNTGKEWGKLGLPTTNETYDGGTARQDFEGGTITWTSTNGAGISYR